MEIHQQMMTGCTLQQILTVVHVRLVVATEEVDLHASHTNLLTPCKLLFTILGFVQTVLRARGSIHPPYRRIIPDQWLHALGIGIGHGILNGLTLVGSHLVHLVPFGIDEHVRQLQRDSHIHIFLDDAVVVGTMVVCPIDPRHHTRVYPTGIFQFTGFADIRHQCRLHDVSQRADDHHAPRGVPVTCQQQVVLVLHHTEHLAFIKQTRCTLPAFDISLSDKSKHTLEGFHQQRISPVGVVLLLDHRTTKTTKCLHLGGGRHREKSLVTVAPLLHPALRPLGDDVGCLLGGHLTVLQVGVFIAEGDTVVIESHHNLRVRSDGCLILIGFIGTMQALAFQHLVVILHIPDKL